MKMIYVATLAAAPDRDSGWIYALRKLGCQVISFCSQPESCGTGLRARVCRRFNIGPANKRMQNDLIAFADREQPEWIHFRLPTEFDRRTIVALRERKIILTQYFNDDPFSKASPLGLHWKFRRALTAYDGHFVYRPQNVESYRKAGAAHVEHCPPSYDPRRHFLAPLNNPNGFIADAAFIGHWENDWRVDCLDALARCGFKVILRGGNWDETIKYRLIGSLAPITHAFGKEYNYIYANVTAGLCFFSKINNDSWTERALEIVAVGGVLVCERTDEARTYFKDREEAYFFSSIDELIAILKELTTNPSKRQEVRDAGHRKLLGGPHTIDHRTAQLVRFVSSIREQT